MSTSVADILELSVAERIEIVEDIWNSIAADSEEPALADDIRAELDDRLKAYQNDPDAGVTWDELSERLTRSR
ncbi:MAG TPA: addiction module protein [Pyrinomonadaceae bacterium]|nr:addiction module protein [Pyrinomonadaceae bacterium]